MIKRPGILSNLGMIPRRKAININATQGFSGYTTPDFSRFGAFGLSRAAKRLILLTPSPAPAPTSTGVTGAIAASDAINRATKQFYMQDPACGPGESMQTKGVPCAGADCCDGADCDPVGTINQETECFDDPNYQKLPMPSSGGFPDCQSRAEAGYPEPCNQQTCPSCFAPKVQAQEQQNEGGISAEDAEAARLAAELQTLEMQQAQIESIVTRPPLMAPPSAYTGSSIPVMTTRQTTAAPTTEQKIAELVAAHETQKAVQRSSAPPPVATRISPEELQPQQTYRAARPASSGGGVMSWLRNALFGSPSDFELDGWGFGQTKNKSNLIIPIIVVLGLLYYFKMKT